jgi:hypothetical protein
MRTSLTLVTCSCAALTIVAAACAPKENASTGIASAMSTQPLTLLFKLQRNGISPSGILSVYTVGYWEFVSLEACALAKGNLTNAELTQVNGYLDDPGLQSGAVDGGSCLTKGFQLNVGDGVVCWGADGSSSGQAAAAMNGLADFLEVRAAQLHWDGGMRDCTLSPPSLSPSPPEGDGSGSGKPVPHGGGQ